MHTQSSVHSTAVQAQEDTVGGTGPTGIPGGAVEAQLVLRLGSQALQELRLLDRVHRLLVVQHTCLGLGGSNLI